MKASYVSTSRWYVSTSRWYGALIRATTYAGTDFWHMVASRRARYKRLLGGVEFIIVIPKNGAGETLRTRHVLRDLRLGQSSAQERSRLCSGFAIACMRYLPSVSHPCYLEPSLRR